MWCHFLLIMPVAGLGLFAVLPLPMALSTYLVISAVSLLVPACACPHADRYWITYQAMRRPVTTGAEGMLGTRAKVVTDLSPRGRIRYGGELWTAEADEPVAAGTRVTIESVDGMRVRVRTAS